MVTGWSLAPAGKKRWRQFKNGGVDLVLTDLIMPGLDGGKLIDAVKTISPQTPAILLSGKVRIYDRDTRADVFLPKGMYAPAELLERIRLSAGAQARTQACTFRKPSRRSVRRSIGAIEVGKTQTSLKHRQRILFCSSSSSSASYQQSVVPR